MFPLRPEISLSPPTLHPCGHLSYAVHPLVVTMTVFSKDTINLPQQTKKQNKKGHRNVQGESKFQRFLLLSRLSVYEHGTSPSGRFITADTSRLEEEEQTRRVFALRYVDGSSPMVIIIIMSSADEILPHARQFSRLQCFKSALFLILYFLSFVRSPVCLFLSCRQ